MPVASGLVDPALESTVVIETPTDPSLQRQKRLDDVDAYIRHQPRQSIAPSYCKCRANEPGTRCISRYWLPRSLSLPA
jgi:hypothetical protein